MMKAAIIAVQEHWLTNENLHRLNSVHPDFIGLGVSGMTNRLASGWLQLQRPSFWWGWFLPAR